METIFVEQTKQCVICTMQNESGHVLSKLKFWYYTPKKALSEFKAFVRQSTGAKRINAEIIYI